MNLRPPQAGRCPLSFLGCSPTGLTVSWPRLERLELSVKLRCGEIWGNFSFVLGLPFDYSVTKSCLTLCDPKDAEHQASLSFNYLLEFAQSHAY